MSEFDRALRAAGHAGYEPFRRNGNASWSARCLPLAARIVLLDSSRFITDTGYVELASNKAGGAAGF
jgi:hypothetical protein